MGRRSRDGEENGMEMGRKIGVSEYIKQSINLVWLHMGKAIQQ